MYIYIYWWGPKNRANSNYTWLLIICKPGILKTISFDRLKSLTSNQQTDGHKHGRNQTKWSYIYIYITVEAVLPSIKSRWWCPSYKSVSKPNEHHSLTIYPTIYNHICPIEPNTSILLSFASAGRTSHYSLKLKDPQPKVVSTQRWIAKDGHHRIFVGIS